MSYNESVRQASETVSEFQKTSERIGEEFVRLKAAKEKLASAEAALCEIIAGGGHAEKPRRAVEARRGEVGTFVEVITGLRNRLLNLAGAMPQLWAALNLGLVDFENGLREDFMRRWDAAMTELTPLLCERKGLEAIGMRFNTPEPIVEARSPEATCPPRYLVGQLVRAVTALMTDGELSPSLNAGCSAPAEAKERVSAIKASLEKVQGEDYVRRCRAAQKR